MQSISNHNNTIPHRYKYCRDGYEYRIKSLMFDDPIPLNKAISEIKSDKTMVDMLSDYRFFNNKILTQIQSDLSTNNDLKNINVKGMIDYGQTALVFETESGDILKITNREHFLGRKPTDFDVPIKTKYKLSSKSFCHYYLEEKADNKLSTEEYQSAIKTIQNKGYKVVDCRYEQFGKTKDGKVVLIDPECARKKGAFGLIKQKFMKIKSFIKMAK